MARHWAAAGGLGPGGQTGTLSRCLGQSLSRLMCHLSQAPPLLWAPALPSGHQDGDEVASKALPALTACALWEVSPEAAHSLGMEDTDKAMPVNYRTRRMTTVHTLRSGLCSEPILVRSSPSSVNPPGATIAKGLGQPCSPSRPRAQNRAAGRDVQIMLTE